MTGPSPTRTAYPAPGQIYPNGTLAKIVALVYLGLAALSPMPYIAEVVSGTTDGSFSILLPVLATAPLSLLTVVPWMMTPPSDGAGLWLLAALVAATAMIQAWVIWRVVRGRGVRPRGVAPRRAHGDGRA